MDSPAVYDEDRYIRSKIRSFTRYYTAKFMFSANMTNYTDHKAVDGSSKFFQHNSSKNVYEKLKL